MKKLKFLAALCLAATLLPSCMTTHTYVGNYQQMTRDGVENTYVYDKGKEFYLFGGLLPLSHTHVPTPETNFDVMTKTTFVDMLISSVTFQLIGIQTIQVNAVWTEKEKKINN
ncbi:MAG: hypothetical protein IKQ46_04665 [Bacteroidales bacterium]|nr:hypothetical protein [Bacteroidales bacterium]MBR6279582.1 hypothetical protein [Bacteroidales bacterium]